MTLRLSLHATTASTCGGLVAECRAYTSSDAAALVTARHSAANASSVTFTANVEIRKLKSLGLVSAGNNPSF